MIKAKHISALIADDDGLRILIEPAWPRFINHRKAGLDLWLRDLAPSKTLLARLSDQSLGWEDFVLYYNRELEKNHEYFPDLMARSMDGGITLLHSSSDLDHNAAVALRTILGETEPDRTPRVAAKPAVSRPSYPPQPDEGLISRIAGIWKTSQG